MKALDLTEVFNRPCKGRELVSGQHGRYAWAAAVEAWPEYFIGMDSVALADPDNDYHHEAVDMAEQSSLDGISLWQDDMGNIWAVEHTA